MSTHTQENKNGKQVKYREKNELKSTNAIGYLLGSNTDSNP